MHWETQQLGNKQQTLYTNWQTLKRLNLNIIPYTNENINY